MLDTENGHAKVVLLLMLDTEKTNIVKLARLQDPEFDPLGVGKLPYIEGTEAIHLYLVARESPENAVN
jgi:hypothetical protein